MIGEVQRLLDQRVEIDRPALAGAAARMLQHALDDAVGALAVLGDLVEVAGQHLDRLVDLGALCPRRASAMRRRGGLLQLVEQLDRQAGEVVDEVQRVLDLVRDAGGELAERGHLLGLDQVGLGRLELLQRGLRLAGSHDCFVACLTHLQRSLLDRVLEPVGCLGPLGEKMVALDRIAPEGLDRLAHCRDLVPADCRHGDFMGASGNVESCGTQSVEAAHDVAPDIQPDDEGRGGKAERHERRDGQRADPLHVGGGVGRIADLAFRGGNQQLGGLSELIRHLDIFHQQVGHVRDEGQLFLSQFRD